MQDLLAMNLESTARNPENPRLRWIPFHGVSLRLPYLPWEGGTPLYKPYMFVSPQRIGFLRRFCLKTGKEFAHFGLESGIWFPRELRVCTVERINCLNPR